jgi:hypothetical protein
MGVVAGGDGSDGCLDVKIVAYAFQVLRLKECACPAAGRGFVEQERATHAIVVTDAIQQRLDLLDCCVSAVLPELQHAPDLRLQLSIKELGDCSLVEGIGKAVLLLKPGDELGNLVDTGDGAFRDLGKLSIDLRRSGLGDLEDGCGDRPIGVEAPAVDLLVQEPELLLVRRQRRYARIQFAFNFDVLLAVLAEARHPLLIVEPTNPVRVFALPRLPGLAHLHHEAMPGGILLVQELKSLRDTLEFGGQCLRQERPSSSNAARPELAASRVSDA